MFGKGPFEQRLVADGFATIVPPMSRLVRRGTRYRPAYGQTVTMMGAGVPAVFRIASIIRRLRVDIVHTNGAKAHLLAGLAGRLAGRPVLWHVRDFPPTRGAGRLFRHALRSFPDMIIANSAAIAGSLAAIGASPSRLVVAHNPVDLGRFAPQSDRVEARRRLGLRADAPTIGLVAHLTPWKGHDQFVLIARRVLESIPDAQFVVAGGSIYETDGHDGYHDRLHELVAQLNLSAHVTFLGRRDDVAGVMAALDVLVHCPTAPEPFGRAVAEAMAAGRPVVAARSGGLPEIVADGATGFLVAPGDIDGFAGRVVQLLSDAALARRLGEAGRAHAESAFPVGVHADRVCEVYRLLCPHAGAAA